MARLLAPIVALILGLALILASDRPLPKADFTFVNHGDVSTLDLQKMSWLQDLRIGRILFEGLVRNDMLGERGTIKPAVAERWELSADHRTYTFHLRANAEWSNGEPVRAGDFIFAWRRALLPDTASDYAAQFQLIQGGREFFDWRSRRLDEFKPGDDAAGLWRQTQAKFTEMVGLSAPDDRTLIVTLRRPVPYFLDLCANAVFFPVYPPLVSQYDTVDPTTGRITSRSGWTRAETIVCDGPFTLASWRFKRDMRFVRNPHYWDPGRINFDSMNCLCIEDISAQVMAFRSGGIDFLTDVSAPYRPDLLEGRLQFDREHQRQIDEMRAQGLDQTTIERLLPPDPNHRDTVHAFHTFGTYFYSFNCLPRLLDGRENPFADPRVRRAFAMAVDKQRITDQVRRLGEHPSATLIPQGSIPGYHSPNGLRHDPVAARDLLAAAGYPGGRGLPTIQILYTRDAGHEFIAQSIKKDWEETLGASVQLAQREIKVFRNDVRSGNYMVSRGSWYGDYGDPTTFLDINRTGDGNNDRKYSSKQFDDLMAASDAETDPARRMAILEDAERIIVEQDLPILPIFRYVQLYMYDPHRLTGITSDPRQEQEVQELDLLGDGKGADKPHERPARPPGGGA
ncbi:MAG TPA: peptide ABC transporter substrate-binding protein [Phycisphaerales bacterium]|nr:peptide ABC transporter substrate-binding protein [Phycisphaerales bacterium]